MGAAMLVSLRAGPLDEAFLKVPTGDLHRGYGICLFDAKGEIWSRYEGWANEERGLAFSRDTVFRVGAVSDLFTVMLALRFLDPERPIGVYLPELFAGAGPGTPLGRVGSLKVGTLMSHLSGTDATFFLGYQDYDPFTNLGAYLKDVNLKYPPETKVLRSGAMIDLLGLALVRASGKGFDQLARTEVFEPLGMKASSFRFQDSPLFATMRYKSAAPDTYATRIPGFRDVVAPSGSMQSSIRDLAAGFAALLRAPGAPGAPPFSPGVLKAMFASRNEAVAQRQGLRVGCGWYLSLPDLAYLGNLAWYAGKHMSHRNVVILLPGLGIGVVCATNAWSIFDRETILPMAVAVIKAYAQASLNLTEAPARLERMDMPPQLKALVGGLYVSSFGIYRVQVEGAGIRVGSDAMDILLDYGGQGVFHPGPGGPLRQIGFHPPDSLTLFLRNGMVIDAQRSRPDPDAGQWLERQGTYRIAQAAPGALYAFSLGSAEGLPVISGDDGIELPLEARAPDRAAILCDESSRFFGKELRVAGDRELRLDGVLYRRM
jgi:CubicO group peptidase (beta-lactamase class C family)